MREVEGEVVKLVVNEEEANGEVGMGVRRKEEVSWVAVVREDSTAGLHAPRGDISYRWGASWNQKAIQSSGAVSYLLC